MPLAQLQKFQLSLTLEFEFDYLEVYTPLEVVEFLKEMHLSILDKPYRKELSMYSRRGFKPSNKAKIAGLTKETELAYISWLMCVPGLSENKAIAVAKTYKTFNQLMGLLKDPNLSEKERKQVLSEVQVASGGEKGKRLGKACSEKIYLTFMSSDPSVVIN